jgi:hypothetical protein
LWNAQGQPRKTGLFTKKPAHSVLTAGSKKLLKEKEENMQEERDDG